MFFLLSLAFADSYTVEEGATLTIPINSETGTVLQLPTAIRMVTPTSHIEITQIGRPATKSSRSKSAAVPVRHLRAKARDNTSEMVTFVLANGAAIAVQLVPSSQADSFADLKFPPKPKPQPTSGGHLQSERALLKTMFRDEPERRELLDEVWTYTEYPDIEWRLRRRFFGDELTGYVFELTNTGRQELVLDPAVLAIDRPNRIALTQLDEDVLGTCKSKTPCKTVLRIVLNGRQAVSSQSPGSLQALPFVQVAANKRGRK